MSMTFEAFRAAALEQGASEVLERRYGAGTVLEPHTHGFAARALVVQGEMWLTVGEQTRHLHPGDRFELEANVLHAERYGPEGAVYWVGRSEPPK